MKEFQQPPFNLQKFRQEYLETKLSLESRSQELARSKEYLQRALQEMEQQQRSLEDEVLKRTRQLDWSYEQLSREIAEKVRAQRQEHLMALFTELNPEPALRFDLEGRITLANKSAKDALGVDPNEAPLLTAVLPQLAGIDLAECIHHGRSLTRIDAIGDKYYHFVIQGISDSGCGHLYARDVTDFKSMAEDLKKAKEAAEEANQAKSWFLATMSHEMRTPLNAIIGMTELTIGTPLTSEQNSFLRTILANAEALLYLINEILCLSRIEAKKLKLETVPFDPAEVVSDVAEAMSVAASHKHLDFFCDLPTDLPGEILGDPGRLQQILANLVDNAIKFTPQGGVELCAARDPSDLPALLFSVRDTGVGIAPENQGKIFQRFFRADAAEEGKVSKGVGLGLDIAKTLAEMMGGKIWVESQLGQGSTFYLRLPYQLPQRVATPAPAAPWLNGRTVLLADGDPRLCRLLLAFLNAWSVRAVPAAGAAELRDRLNGQEHYDLLIASEELLQNTDPLLGERLKNFLENGAGQILLLSSLPQMQSRPVREIDIADRLLKPLTPRRLWRSLEKALAAGGVDGAGPSATTIPGHDRPRLLLIEDNIDSQNYIYRVLRNAGYWVDIAGDGGIALEKIRHCIYDLILTDLKMPVYDGFEVTRRIRSDRQRPEMNNVPIIALTAHGVEGYREHCLRSGMNDYLLKPVRSAELLRLVTRWLEARPVILVVDDSPENLTIISRYLAQRQDWTVVTADNSAEAIAEVNRRRVSLILLDLLLPGKSGYEIVRELRAQPPAARLPIIAMSAFSAVEVAARCREAGFDGYLAKPVRRESLLSLIDEYLLSGRQEKRPHD